MAEFNIRTDSVDVEQIMRQIRARIKEKRGVDYTEQQIQELANVKLERFLDPKGVRSDLVEQFKRTRDTRLEPFVPEQYGFDADMLYGSHRGIVRLVRRILNPILKMFFNPNPLIQVLHWQTQINALYERQFHLLREKSQQRDEVDILYYELVHNLVLELTRVGIEAKNLKMRLESLNSRMDFDERRARALEGVVQYRPGTGAAREPAFAKGSGEAGSAFAKGSGEAGSAFAKGSGEAGPAVSKGSGEGRRSRQAENSATQRHQQSHQEPHGEPAHVQEAQGPGAEAAEQTGEAGGTAATATARRRRRRRRGRRGGRGRALGLAENPSATTPPHGDATADAAFGSASAGPLDDDAAADTLYDDSDSDSDADPGSQARQPGMGPGSGDDEEPDPSEQ